MRHIVHGLQFEKLKDGLNPKMGNAAPASIGSGGPTWPPQGWSPGCGNVQRSKAKRTNESEKRMQPRDEPQRKPTQEGKDEDCMRRGTPKDAAKRNEPNSGGHSKTQEW